MSATEEGVAHVGVEGGKAQALREELAVDVGHCGEGFVCVVLAVFRGCIKDFKELGETRAEIGAVATGAFFDVELEGGWFKDASVFGEEAEEDADEEAFEIVAAIAAGFEGVVKSRHDGDGLQVDGVLLGETV